jgi:hypothetical protein
MNLLVALSLYTTSTISSVTVRVTDYVTSFVHNSNKVYVYKIESLDKLASCKLLVENNKYEKLDNGIYKLESTVTNVGLEGVKIEQLKNWPKNITCSKYSRIIKLKENEIMNDIETTNYDLTDLMKYYGKTYLTMRNTVAKAPNVTDQQAHEVSIGFLEFIPTSWFGQKPLPQEKGE